MYLAIIIFEEYNYFNLTEYISAGYIMVIPNTIIINMVFYFSKKFSSINNEIEINYFQLCLIFFGKRSRCDARHH